MKRINSIGALIILATVMTTGCSSISLPSLEDPACTEARESARSFYSVHFGGDLKPTEESLKARSAALTGAFASRLRAENPQRIDPFTLTEDYPRAFKFGGCEARKDGAVELEVQLLWRDQNVTKQESVYAIMTKNDGRWLIDGIVRRK
jgi:hypothetical protein